MLMIFAYDIRGVLTRQTVNGTYKKGYIQKALRPAFRRKRPELLVAGPTSPLARYKWETLPHPSYSMDRKKSCVGLDLRT